MLVSLPHLMRCKEVGTGTLGRVGLPVVARRIPHGEAPVDLGVEHKPWNGGPAVLDGPPLLLAVERTFVRVAARSGLRVAVGELGFGRWGSGNDQMTRPGPCQGPPGNVQEE